MTPDPKTVEAWAAEAHLAELLGEREYALTEFYAAAYTAGMRRAAEIAGAYRAERDDGEFESGQICAQEQIAEAIRKEADLT